MPFLTVSCRASLRAMSTGVFRDWRGPLCSVGHMSTWNESWHARTQAAEGEAGLPASVQITLGFNQARVLEAAGSAGAAARQYEGILQVAVRCLACAWRWAPVLCHLPCCPMLPVPRHAGYCNAGSASLWTCRAAWEQADLQLPYLATVLCVCWLHPGPEKHAGCLTELNPAGRTDCSPTLLKPWLT